MKDIFIDNNVASRFSNPLDPEYLKLIRWLKKYDPANIRNCAILVVSIKLLEEYYSSAMYAKSNTSIPIIIDQLTREGRLRKFTNLTIKDFIRTKYTKKISKNLRCNRKDRNHIPIVLLSQRQFAISIDDNFIYDLINFPGYHVTAVKRPELINYE